MTTRRFVFPALIAAGILWGTTVPMSKLALGWLPPGWLALARFALAAAVLMIASRSRLRAAFSPAIVISGGLGYGGSVLLQNIGIDRTSVTHAALLIGATPVLVAVLAAALGHSVAKPLAWAGFGLSLAGIAVIAGGRGTGSTLSGDGLVLASQLVCAGFTVSQARLLRGRDPVAVTGLQLMAAGILVAPVALATEHRMAGPISMTALLATLGLVLAGTVGPTTLFAFGQSRVSADVAGAFLNIEPLVGAILGMMLFASPLGAAQVAGGAAIVAGIGLSSFQVVRGERLRTTEVVVPLRAEAGAPRPALVAARTAAISGSGGTGRLLAASAERLMDRAPDRAGRLDRPHPKIGRSARSRRLRLAARRQAARRLAARRLAASTRPASGGRWRHRRATRPAGRATRIVGADRGGSTRIVGAGRGA